MKEGRPGSLHLHANNTLPITAKACGALSYMIESFHCSSIVFFYMWMLQVLQVDWVSRPALHICMQICRHCCLSKQLTWKHAV